MTQEELLKLVEDQQKLLADQQRRIERMEAVNAIQNVMAKYAAYHVASEQVKTAELYCRHTPGTRLIFNGDIYDEWEGVERHFIKRMSNAEEDLSGRLYLHDMVSPLIEVAEDGLTADCMFSSHGCETGWNPDGSLKACWAFNRYHFVFVKEDGEWRIWRQEMHQILNTPFEGKGWVEEPCYDIIGNAPQYLKDSTAAMEDCQPHRKTKHPYLALSTETAECDAHNLIPVPPLPYKVSDPEHFRDEDDTDWHW